MEGIFFSFLNMFSVVVKCLIKHDQIPYLACNKNQWFLLNFLFYVLWNEHFFVFKDVCSCCQTFDQTCSIYFSCLLQKLTYFCICCLISMPYNIIFLILKMVLTLASVWSNMFEEVYVFILNNNSFSVSFNVLTAL